MDTVIYYFTSTGNSLETARLIAQKLGNTQLISIPSVINSEEIVCAASRIGFIFPVYMFGLPLIVKRFMEKLQITNTDPYIFSIATCGGIVGAANLQLKKILQKNKLDLQSGFSIKMPGNYTPMYSGPDYKTTKKIIDKASAAANQIAGRIERREKTLAKNLLFVALLTIVRPLYEAGLAGIPTEDKNFWIKDTCNSCGICVRICPVSNIHLQNGKPLWLNRCEQCLGCLQWCPVEAIQHGKTTAKRRRYHHPAVNVLDIEKSR